MAKNPEQRRDRYDVSGNVEAQYVDAAQTVLRNKAGITDLATLQTVEEESLARAYRSLVKEVRTDTRLKIDAAKAAFKRQYAPIIEIIRQALARAQNRP
jgi:cell filamentation protein